MAAHSTVVSASSASSASARPTVWIDRERRGSRSEDPERALQLQLDAVVAEHELDLLVIADSDGAPVEMSGDPDLGMELAQYAAAAFRKHPETQTHVTSRGFLVVAPVQTPVRTFVIAAQGRWSIPDPQGFSRALAGVTRILKDGLFVHCEAPMALVRRA
jgi:ribose 5-phosphate isomerase